MIHNELRSGEETYVHNACGKPPAKQGHEYRSTVRFHVPDLLARHGAHDSSDSTSTTSTQVLILLASRLRIYLWSYTYLLTVW